jgi:hypothetical protein
MPGLRATEAAGWTAASGGAVTGREIVEALSTKVFREASPARARLPQTSVSRTPAFHPLPSAIILRAGKRTEPDHRGQLPRLLRQWRGLLHEGRPASNDVPIERASRRRGRVFRGVNGRAGVLPLLGFRQAGGEEGRSRRREGRGREGSGNGVRWARGGRRRRGGRAGRDVWRAHLHIVYSRVHAEIFFLKYLQQGKPLLMHNLLRQLF